MDTGSRGGAKLNLLLDDGLDTQDLAAAPLARSLAQHLPDAFVLVLASARADRVVVPAERRLVDEAVATRRAEFITGRWCAHRALHALGQSCDVLAIGPLGGPAWPPGTVGSITHDRGWCMVVVGPRRGVRGIGIDLFAKSDLNVLPRLSHLIHSPCENRRYADRLSCKHHLRKLFCIKEAVVKAISQELGRYLDLRELDVAMDGASFEAAAPGIASGIRGWHGESQVGAAALAVLPHSA